MIHAVQKGNFFLVGIIPGPGEPSLNINTYLSPLVSDLLSLWKGIPLRIYGTNGERLARAAVLIASCDESCAVLDYYTHYIVYTVYWYDG